MEGFDVIQTIRRNGVTTPVIIISGRNEDYDFMYGLSLGATIMSPSRSARRSLGAKVKALIRRSKSFLAGEQPADHQASRSLRHHHHAVLKTMWSSTS